MKNLVFFISAICVISLAACKKDAGNKTTNKTTTPTDGWTLGTTSYKEVFGSHIATNPGGGTVHAFVAFDAIPSGPSSSANTFQAVFANIPSVNGTYHVVAYPAALTANQAGIVAAGPAATYTSTGTTSVDVTVTVTDGKVKVVVPSVPLKNSSSADVLNATGTIIEN